MTKNAQTDLFAQCQKEEIKVVSVIVLHIQASLLI